ncbi:MAG: DUF72 domain-containing protein [Alphaproteobacteria bacterium]|nr:DUF72 domain-containing protein [Alphaproteobacteria bacterium]
MTVRIGISGWRYARWRGVFYPKGLRQKDELAYAARTFPTVEINGTFYSMQRPAFFAAWADAVPTGFVFAVKGPRFITHMLKLNRAETPLANFFATGVLRLGRKLGPILWQLPPNLAFNADKLESFFALLPRTADQAAQLATRHDNRLKAASFLDAGPAQRLRHAIEVRHDSFRDPAFIALLRRHNVALVCADTVDWPLLMDVTADFVYCRLHGSTQLYTSGYGPKALATWATRIHAWSAGGDAKGIHASPIPARRRSARDVYVYFDNDAKVRAPLDAQVLMRLLDLGPRSTPARRTALPCDPSRTGSSARH